MEPFLCGSRLSYTWDEGIGFTGLGTTQVLVSLCIQLFHSQQLPVLSLFSGCDVIFFSWPSDFSKNFGQRFEECLHHPQPLGAPPGSTGNLCLQSCGVEQEQPPVVFPQHPLLSTQRLCAELCAMLWSPHCYCSSLCSCWGRAWGAICCTRNILRA